MCDMFAIERRKVTAAEREVRCCRAETSAVIAEGRGITNTWGWAKTTLGGIV